jgi:L-rhamnose mutarotase
MIIVCYTGGCCGDLISAIIDSRDTTLVGSTIKHADTRVLLKKPHLLASDSEKDQYIQTISSNYNSIPSHDLEYHKHNKPRFVSVIVHNFDIAYWAADRFKKLHRPHVWNEMQKVCGVNNVREYAEILIHYSNMVVEYADYVVKLEDIVSGDVISKLENYCPINESGKDLYRQWRSRQTT